MTNTIPNVPRELLDSLLTVIESNGYAADEVEVVDELRVLLSAPSPADHCEDVRAMVAAPSPAGVDGLEVRAYEDSGGALYTAKLLEIMAVDSVGCEPLCRLSDANAIIDGLLGEKERIRLNIAEYNESIACYQSERDQQAQRIGELEGLLRAESARVDFLDAYIVTADAPDTGKAAMLADSGTLRECIDAALSAGKADAQ